jgi:hypothetical protein
MTATPAALLRKAKQQGEHQKGKRSFPYGERTSQERKIIPDTYASLISLFAGQESAIVSDRGVAQFGLARLNGVQKVVGSSPTSPIDLLEPQGELEGKGFPLNESLTLVTLRGDSETK